MGGIRAFKFAKYLPLFGWNPLVITTPLAAKSKKDDSLLVELSQDIEIHRPFFLNIRKYLRGDILKLLRPLEKKYLFPDKYVLWNSSVYKYIVRHIIPATIIDATYVSMGPHSSMFIAHRLKQQFHIPFFLDFRDPFSFYQYTVLDQNAERAIRAKMVETGIFQHADAINIVTTPWMEKYAELYPEFSHKMSDIHNGYDEADFVDIPDHKGKNKFFTIGYNGTFSRLEPLNPLIDAITEIHREKGITIQLNIATSTSISKIRKDFSYAISNGLINYKGFLPHRDSLINLKQSDASLLSLLPVPATEGQIPAKTYEYFRIKNPIICLNRPDGHIAKLIERTKTGVIVDINNYRGIVETLLDMNMKWKKNQLDYSPDLSEIQKFERKNQTKVLARKFKALLLSA
ncbi:MAG: hypothetical protein HKM93_14915 [Desulfobacteraceae bacterium]|nr:hypothetical protein [Desulfobacteraceae bacterium]